MTSQQRSFVIGIAGGSGAGKSWLADRLQEALGGARSVTRLSLDDFYRDRSRVAPAVRSRINYDHPRAIDWPDLVQVVRALRFGRGARLPQYDFSTHSRLGTRIPAVPRPFVIVDGLWVLRRRDLQPHLDLRIFVECPGSMRFQRRLERDTASRGRDEHSVRTQFYRTVAPMHDRFVQPQRKVADIVFSGAATPESISDLSGEILRLASTAIVQPNPNEATQ